MLVFMYNDCLHTYICGTSSSKKQKVSGAFLDQSIEQLNDVTAVSGVNLRVLTHIPLLETR